MVRIIGYVVGLAFAGVLLISLFGGVSDYMSNPPAPTAEEEFHKEHLKPLHLASDGPFGHFDKKQLPWLTNCGRTVARLARAAREQRPGWPGRPLR